MLVSAVAIKPLLQSVIPDDHSGQMTTTSGIAYVLFHVSIPRARCWEDRELIEPLRAALLAVPALARRDVLLGPVAQPRGRGAAGREPGRVPRIDRQDCCRGASVAWL